MSVPFELTFTTKRLVHRPLLYQDFASCQRAKRASILTNREANGVMLAISQDHFSSFRIMVDYRRTRMDNDRDYWFGSFIKSTGQFIGEVMLYDVVRGDVQNAVVGANICSVFRGKGYGKEAMRGLVRYAFACLKLHRLEGLVDPTNLISVAMCQRAGFRKEGLRLRCVKENRRWKDKIVLAITREEL